MVRPIEYRAAELWPAILEQIANGSSLSAIARQKGAPSYSWLKTATRNDPELRKRYEQAVEDRADLLAEEIERLADEPIPEGLDGPGLSAWVQRQRLRVDARKWTASKLRPKAWGDALQLKVEGMTVQAAHLEAVRALCQGNVIDHESDTEDA
jgi:hypothetical protein